MTIAEMLTYLRNRHNEEGAISPNWSDAELYAILQNVTNSALSTLGLVEGKSTATVSVSGTADYAFPTDFIRIRRVLYDGVALKYLNFRQYEARIPAGTAPSGTPREYTLWNDTMMLVPTPSVSADVITVYGEKMQGSITVATSRLNTPAVFDGAICDGALVEMFIKDLNPQMAQFYQGRWNNQHLPAMMKFAARRRRVGSPTTILDTDSLVETEYGLV